MPQRKYAPGEIVERGRLIYFEALREQLEPQHHGDYVAINVETGEYRVGSSLLDFGDELARGSSDPPVYVHRIGYRAAARISGPRRPRYSIIDTGGTEEASMSTTNALHADISRRGREIYERQLRAGLEPEHNGEFVVIDVDTGDFELDPDSLLANHRLRARRPNGVLYLARVGYPTAFKLGGRAKVSTP